MAALQCHVNVLYMDSDIFLLKNPFPFLYQYNSLDFVAQQDYTVCTGFIFLWHTKATLRMLEVARNIRWIINGGDQRAVQSVVDVIKEIKYKLLPTNLFMNGDIFFSKYQHSWDFRSDHYLFSLYNRFRVNNVA